MEDIAENGPENEDDGDGEGEVAVVEGVVETGM